MRKFLAILLSAVLLCFGGCANEQKQEEATEMVVNLYAAPGTIPESVLQEFTKGTGIFVKCYNLDNEEEALKKLGTGISPFDLIFANNLFMERAVAQGVLQEIDTDAVPNQNQILPEAKALLTPESSAYMLPYTRTCAVLLHNVGYTRAPVVSYSSLWSPHMAGKVSVLPEARLMTSVALKANGLSVNATSEPELQRAQEVLCALAPNVYDYKSEEPGEGVAAGLSGLSVVWAKDADTAYAKNDALEVLYPDEGAIVKMNCMAISATAPHKRAAYLLMDYLLRAENSMAVSKHLQEESLHIAGAELQDPDYESMVAVHMAKKYEGTAVECLHYVMPEEKYTEVWKAVVKAVETIAEDAGEE